MLKELKSLLSFLTIFPLSMNEDCLVNAARGMFLFPLVGAFIGLLAGAFGWVAYQFLPALVVGGLALGMLLLITGLHHTDGLLDFGDAVIYHGTAERKIEIMHDQFTGAGALALGIMTYLLTAFSIAALRSGIIIQSLIVVEASAKLSMVVMAWAGRPVHEGMASSFIDAMHGKKGNIRLVAALVISFGVAVPLLWSLSWWTGAVTVTAAILASLVMVGISHRHFKGITGDVLGATNELTRMVVLIVLLAIIQSA